MRQLLILTRLVIISTILALALTTGALGQTGVITLDDITNDCGSGGLYAGITHQVSIRYNLLSLDPTEYWYVSNGFEIYSPDGADWGYFEVTTGPLLTTAIGRGRLQTIGRHQYFDGSAWTMTAAGGSDPAPGSGGVDTRAGYYLRTYQEYSTGGFLGGVDNDIALTLEFESRMADEGLTLCLDTTEAFTAWEWSNGDEDFPLWDNGLGVDGPRCWDIVAVPSKASVMPPYWCYESDNLVSGYGEDCSYQLCANIDWSGCDAVPLIFSLAPPYDNGEYGTVDPVSGRWTWPGSEVKPGYHDIEFRVETGMGETAFTNFHLLIYVSGCDGECVGRVGDVNLSGDEPTISDISMLIDHLFITGTKLPCLTEADVNQSGGANPTDADITIGDISVLIDYLFITGPSLGLPDCL